jgi:hypothetical protein
MEYWEWFFIFIAATSAINSVIVLVLHFVSLKMDGIPTRDLRFHNSMSWGAGYMAMIMYLGMGERPLVIAVITVFTFAVALYTIVCNWLTYGGMSKLTRWRGEKWVKEIDYLYLFLGAVGLFWLLNSHPLTTYNITRLGLAPPLVVATALVLRLIKTRAEIGGWNKLPAQPKPTAPLS